VLTVVDGPPRAAAAAATDRCAETVTDSPPTAQTTSLRQTAHRADHITRATEEVT